MQVLLKAGREGVYYKAKMLRSTCKGYTNVTCKLIKEGKANIMNVSDTYKYR